MQDGDSTRDLTPAAEASPPAPSTVAGPSAPEAAPRGNPAAKRPAPRGRRMTTNLVMLSSVAILSVFTAGYARTQGAENQILARQNQAASVAANLANPNLANPNLANPTATSVPNVSLPPAAATPAPIAPSSNDGTTSGFARQSQRGNGSFAGAPARSPGVSSLPTSPPATPTSPPATATPSASSAAAAAPSPAAVASKYQDGTYVGSGYSRHGGVTAKVVIQGGKIISAAISGCTTRYPCSDIAGLPAQTISQQGPPVDLVSGATDSSDAYVGAIEDALSQAQSHAAAG